MRHPSHCVQRTTIHPPTSPQPTHLSKPTQIRAKDAAKTAVTITECEQPSPRTNFSLTTLPSGELLLFGGEYYDGDDTVVYNGVFR